MDAKKTLMEEARRLVPTLTGQSPPPPRSM